MRRLHSRPRRCCSFPRNAVCSGDEWGTAKAARQVLRVKSPDEGVELRRLACVDVGQDFAAHGAVGLVGSVGFMADGCDGAGFDGFWNGSPGVVLDPTKEVGEAVRKQFS